VKQNYKKEKILGLDNSKLKLRMKIRGDNASEDAGSIVWGTDITKPGSPVKVIFGVHWVTRIQTTLYEWTWRERSNKITQKNIKRKWKTIT
jgi:hypothetical protein